MIEENFNSPRLNHEKDVKKLKHKLHKLNNERENVNYEFAKYSDEIDNLKLEQMRNNEEFQNKL